MRIEFIVETRSTALCHRRAIINRSFSYKYPISGTRCVGICHSEAPIRRVRTYKRHTIVTWLDYVVPPSACLLLLVDPPPPFRRAQGVFCALSHIACESSVRILCVHRRHYVHHYPVITVPIDRHRPVRLCVIRTRVYITKDVPRIRRTAAAAARAFSVESTVTFILSGYFSKSVLISCVTGYQPFIETSHDNYVPF